MNLTELEVAAGRLLEEQKRLKTLDAEIGALSQEIKQDPKRNEKDQAFYSLIGMDWTDPGHKERDADLRKERDTVHASIRDAEAKVLQGISSEHLIVPLEPTPTIENGASTFKFRAGATFPKSVEEISILLGIATPLRIGEVVIYDDKITVNEADEFFAKKKIVEAFEDIRKTVRRRLSP